MEIAKHVCRTNRKHHPRRPQSACRQRGSILKNQRMEIRPALPNKAAGDRPGHGKKDRLHRARARANAARDRSRSSQEASHESPPRPRAQHRAIVVTFGERDKKKGPGNRAFFYSLRKRTEKNSGLRPEPSRQEHRVIDRTRLIHPTRQPFRILQRPPNR